MCDTHYCMQSVLAGESTTEHAVDDDVNLWAIIAYLCKRVQNVRMSFACVRAYVFSCWLRVKNKVPDRRTQTQIHICACAFVSCSTQNGVIKLRLAQCSCEQSQRVTRNLYIWLRVPAHPIWLHENMAFPLETIRFYRDARSMLERLKNRHHVNTRVHAYKHLPFTCANESENDLSVHRLHTSDQRENGDITASALRQSHQSQRASRTLGVYAPAFYTCSQVCVCVCMFTVWAPFSCFVVPNGMASNGAAIRIECMQTIFVRIICVQSTHHQTYTHTHTSRTRRTLPRL